MPTPLRGLGMHHLIVQRLVEANGAVVRHADLVAAVYGPDPPAYALVSIRRVVSRMRDLWSGIETQWGVGYRLRPGCELARSVVAIEQER